MILNLQFVWTKINLPVYWMVIVQYISSLSPQFHDSFVFDHPTLVKHLRHLAENLAENHHATERKWSIDHSNFLSRTRMHDIHTSYDHKKIMHWLYLKKKKKTICRSHYIFALAGSLWVGLGEVGSRSPRCFTSARFISRLTWTRSRWFEWSADGLSARKKMYPLVITNSLLLKMAI